MSSDEHDGDDIDLASLDDDELTKQMHDDLYDGLADEIVEGTTILLDRGGARIGCSPKRWSRGCASSASTSATESCSCPRCCSGERDEGGHGDPPPVARRDRGRADRQDGDRHGQGRHPRHRQEPRGDDDGGRRVRGRRPRDQQRRRQVPRRPRGAPTGHPRHVGAADDDDAVHEGRHRHDGREGLRDRYIVLVGGAPLNEEFGQAVGADAYCRDAAVAAETAQRLVGARRLARAEPPGPSVA